MHNVLLWCTSILGDIQDVPRMMTLLHVICMTAVSHAFHTYFMSHIENEESRKLLKIKKNLQPKRKKHIEYSFIGFTVIEMLQLESWFCHTYLCIKSKSLRKSLLSSPSVSYGDAVNHGSIIHVNKTFGCSMTFKTLSINVHTLLNWKMSHEKRRNQKL